MYTFTVYGHTSYLDYRFCLDVSWLQLDDSKFNAAVNKLRAATEAKRAEQRRLVDEHNARQEAEKARSTLQRVFAAFSGM